MLVKQFAAEHRGTSGSMTMTEITDPWTSARKNGASEAYACSSLPLQRTDRDFSFGDERPGPHQDRWRQTEQAVARKPAQPSSESEGTILSTDDQRFDQHPSFSIADHAFAVPRTVPRHTICTEDAGQDDEAQSKFHYLPTPPTSRSATMDSCSLDHYGAYGLEEEESTLQSNQTTDLPDGSQTTKVNTKQEGTTSKASPKGTIRANSSPAHSLQWLDSDQPKDGLRPYFIDTTLPGSEISKSQISHNSDSTSRLHRLGGAGSLEASRGRAMGGDIATQVTTTADNRGFSDKTRGDQTGDWPGGGGFENQTRTNQKRRLISTGCEDDYDDSGKDGHKSKKAKLQKEEAETKRFACPFFKHNPEGYRTSRTCMGPGWATVQRVKEHLLRRHQLPEYRCPRCFDDFTTEPKYRDHVRRQEACSTRAQPLAKEGINKEQAELLKKRKKNSSAKTEEDRWNEVYKILFPNEAVPSPCEQDIPKKYMGQDEVNIGTDYEPEVSASSISPAIMAQCQNFRRQVLETFVEVIRENVGQDSPEQVQSFIHDQRLEKNLDDALLKVIERHLPAEPSSPLAQGASAESSQENQNLWDGLHMLHDPVMSNFEFNNTNFLTVPEISAPGERSVESTSTMSGYEAGASSAAEHGQLENELNYVWGPLNDAEFRFRTEGEL
ncbi:hypothetical protein ACJZ2D_009738 [Fusarium nematophilum]